MIPPTVALVALALVALAVISLYPAVSAVVVIIYFSTIDQHPVFIALLATTHIHS